MQMYVQHAAKEIELPLEPVRTTPFKHAPSLVGGSCAAVTLCGLGGFAIAYERSKRQDPAAKRFVLGSETGLDGRTLPERLGTFSEYLTSQFRRVFRFSANSMSGKPGDPEWLRRVRSYSIITWIASNEYPTNIEDGDALRDFFLDNGFVVHVVDGGVNPNHPDRISRNIRYYAAFLQVNLLGELDPFDVSTITTIRLKDVHNPNPEPLPYVPKSRIDSGAGRTDRGTLKPLSPKIRRVASNGGA